MIHYALGRYYHTIKGGVGLQKLRTIIQCTTISTGNGNYKPILEISRGFKPRLCLLGKQPNDKVIIFF